MEIINTKRIWEIFQIIDKIEEENEDVVLKYNTFNNYTYEDFLEWWSFKILKDTIMVYNDDQIPYEDDTWNDFNYIPFSVMKMLDEDVEKWVLEEIKKKEKEKEAVEREQQRKEALLHEIKRNREVLEKDFGIKFE